MKKKKEIKRQKISVDVEHRLTKLEQGLEGVKKDIEEVMLNVTNHIPTSIKEVKADLQTLLDRKKEKEAIREFLAHSLKLVWTIVGIMWILLQVIEHFYGIKEGIARMFLGA